MTAQFQAIAQRVGADGTVTPLEVQTLRQECWPDGRISQEEAEAIFALNRQLTERGPDWTDFFVEAIGEFVINQMEPRGYVSEANAAWLMEQIDADGKLGSMAELEVLVRVFERAQNVPLALKDYAVRQIERAVLEGTGPTRDGGQLEAGNVNETEAKLLRRAIFAPASERPAAVGKSEAEMLFRLKDATLGANNSPEWKRLFVQGVANYLQGYSDANAQISRERASALQAFMADTSHGIGSFLGRVARSRPTGFGSFFADGKVAPSRDEDVAAAQDVTRSEKDWLDTKIGADGKVDEYERALLEFLAEE